MFVIWDLSPTLHSFGDGVRFGILKCFKYNYMLRLHNIKPNKKAVKKRKRVGRGNASGHGTYSGRGIKGQRSRSGGKSGLKRLGMKMILRNIPKKRGFKSD
ncbi:hypothetical protein KAU19_04310, partial [Candidatus Parcubacteria bacterium]|nr:hypothetical protein [Candidatus Parcubacteria bacterium]